jgi:hypothetical protein
MSGPSSSDQVAVAQEDRYSLHPRMALQMPSRQNCDLKCPYLNCQELKFELLSQLSCSVATPVVRYMRVEV